MHMSFSKHKVFSRDEEKHKMLITNKIYIRNPTAVRTK